MNRTKKPKRKYEQNEEVKEEIRTEREGRRGNMNRTKRPKRKNEQNKGAEEEI